MEQAHALEKFYDNMVKKHKQLTKKSIIITQKGDVDLKLALDLQTLNEEMKKFCLRYGNFIRTRNKGYGKFKKEIYLSWLDSKIIKKDEKEIHIKSADLDFITKDEPKSVEELVNDITSLAYNKSEKNYRLAEQIEAMHIPIKSASIATNKTKRVKIVKDTNNEKIKKKCKNLSQSHKKKENVMIDDIKRIRSKLKQNAINFIDDRKANKLTANNKYKFINNESDKIKKTKTKQPIKKKYPVKQKENKPNANFYIQNIPLNMAITNNDESGHFNHPNINNTVNRNANQQNNFTLKNTQVPLNYNNNSELLRNRPMASENSINPIFFQQERKLGHYTKKNVSPTDKLQNKVSINNNKKMGLVENKKTNSKKSATPELSNKNYTKEESIKFIESSALFKMPLKEDDELSMARNIYKSVYGIENPTEEELLAISEMYDVYLETISHTSCMIAKVKNKMAIEEDDIKLAIKMEFDIEFPDDFAINMDYEIVNDYEKKMAMIAKERRKGK